MGRSRRRAPASVVRPVGTVHPGPLAPKRALFPTDRSGGLDNARSRRSYTRGAGQPGSRSPRFMPQIASLPRDLMDSRRARATAWGPTTRHRSSGAPPDQPTTSHSHTGRRGATACSCRNAIARQRAVDLDVLAEAARAPGIFVQPSGRSLWIEAPRCRAASAASLQELALDTAHPVPGPRKANAPSA